MVPGHLSVDEGTYHLMVLNLAERGSLAVWNGYEEHPSPELELGTVTAHRGRLVSRYPALSAALSLPFYLAAGFSGLFALNNIAFLGVVLTTALMAKTVTGEVRLAVLSASILAVGTFAWQYSQEAWPHALSMLLVVAAFYANLRSLRASGAARAWRWAALAGLAGGIGIGIRVDVGLLLPCLLIPHLFSRPIRLAGLAGLAAGYLPGLVAVATTNAQKFGVFSPFSQGPGAYAPGRVSTYLPLLALGLAVALAVWMAARTRLPRLAARHPTVVVAAVLLLLVAGAQLFPSVMDLAERIAKGSYQLAVDLRVRDGFQLAIEEPELSGSGEVPPSGGVVYARHLKKALLQSCPYLVVALLPAVRLLRPGCRRVELASLYLVPGVFIAFFSYFVWHGGMCLNVRYLLPVLPFFSVLTALALRQLGLGDVRHGGRWMAGGVAAALVAYAALPRGLPQGVATQELVFLRFPLWLAVTTGLAAVAAAALPLRARRLFRPAALACVAAGIAWAAAVAFFYDYPGTRAVRDFNNQLGLLVDESIADDSILFCSYPDPFFRLIERDRVRIAQPSRDDFADFRELIVFHLRQGRPVYAAFPPRQWETLVVEGLLRGYRSETLWRGPAFGLVRVVESTRGGEPLPGPSPGAEARVESEARPGRPVA
jgi:hypothetical protein